MPVPSAVLTPNESVQWSPAGPAALALTTAGALRVQRPRGPLVQAGTVNLIPNPLLTNITGWGSDYGTRAFGDKSIVITSAGTTSSLNCYTSAAARIAIVAGQTYALAADVHNGTNTPINVVLRLRKYNESGSQVGDNTSPTTVLAPGETQRISFASVINAGVVSAFALFTIASVSGAVIPSGQFFSVSKPQLELGEVTTEFVDPADPDTYWIAAANNSPSVRSDRFAQMPLGWFVEEGTTNFDPNPISASEPHSFNLYAHVGGARITNAGLDHPTAGLINTAMRITITSTPAQQDIVGFGHNASALGFSIAVGAVLTQQVFFRVSPKLIGRSIGLYFRKFGGADQYVIKTVIGTGDWQYADLTMTVESPDGTQVLLYIRPTSTIIGDAGMVGEWIDFTATQLEQKPYATSLAHGGMGVGYSLGAANVSERIRSRVQALTGATIPTNRGSLYAVVMVNPATTNRTSAADARATVLMAVGYIGSSGQHQMCVYYDRTNKRIYGSAGVSGLAQGTMGVLGAPVSVYMEWNGTNVAFDYGDGVGKRYVTATFNPSTNWNSGLSLGESGNANDIYGGEINGYVFTNALFSRPLTDAELAKLRAIPTEELPYASIVGIGPQLGGLLLTHPDPGFAVLRTHGGT